MNNETTMKDIKKQVRTLVAIAKKLADRIIYESAIDTKREAKKMEMEIESGIEYSQGTLDWYHGCVTREIIKIEAAIEEKQNRHEAWLKEEQKARQSEEVAYRLYEEKYCRHCDVFTPAGESACIMCGQVL